MKDRILIRKIHLRPAANSQYVRDELFVLLKHSRPERSVRLGNIARRYRLKPDDDS